MANETGQFVSLLPQVTLRPIAVCTSAATSGAAVEAGLPISGLLPVGLERGGPVTSQYASSES